MMSNLNTNTHLNHQNYTVALICALEVELSAARYMLDEEHGRLPTHKLDPNTYILGTLSGHNTVIAALPQGSLGTVSAATVATNLSRTFPAIELRLLVGIGGGIPSTDHDIRLGDVVLALGGVVEYDSGKETAAGFKRKGTICHPPAEWRTAMRRMRSAHWTRPNRIDEFIQDMVRRHPRLVQYRRPPPEEDNLFSADYKHAVVGSPCGQCDRNKRVFRGQRAPASAVFYGLIASGNRVIKNAQKRDTLAQGAGGAICFEMEAAGLMNHFQCIVIRGIADYSDSHKNDDWHRYAAAAAAALAKELLTYIGPSPRPQGILET
ncbi:nucleoside phosphorylase domain-containing protein [Aspergillus falconensis]